MINYSTKGCYFLLWIIYMLVKSTIKLLWKILSYIIGGRNVSDN